MEIFGFKLTKAKKEKKLAPSFVPPTETEGAIDVSQSNTFKMDFDASYKDTASLIQIYREMAGQSDVSFALDEILNDAIVFDEGEPVVSVSFSESTSLSKNIRNKISDEFNNVLRLLKFDVIGDDLFKRWYIDGRIFFHIVLNKAKTEIEDIRLIDPRHIKKVVDIKKEKDKNGIEIIKSIEESFIYNDPAASQNGYIKKDLIKIPKDAIIYASSGEMSSDGKEAISFLHPAIRPYNMLLGLQDALVIYKITRAPERRIYYVDVGNLPKTRAEEYINGIISKHKNNITYNAKTGSIKGNRHILSMMEDVWLPRREGSRGTEVDTLSGGSGFGDVDELMVFHKALYTALKIPASRLEADAAFNLGRSSEITRDEIKFSKFINKIRKRFSKVFRKALKTQLILKNIVTEEEWNDGISSDISFKFNSDSHFSELKQMDILNSRLEVMSSIQEYINAGYYSPQWAMKNVLKLNDEQIAQIEKDRAELGLTNKPGTEEV